MRAMSNRPKLAKKILDAIEKKRQYWGSVQKNIMLDYRACAVYERDGNEGIPGGSGKVVA